jgi:hypothetical protein
VKGRIALALVAAAACSHPATTTTTTTPTNTPPTGRPDFTGEDAALIPATTQLVGGLDWGRVHGSPLFAQLVQPRLDAAPEMSMVRSTCGFDPLSSITSATIAVASVDRPDEGEVIVHGIPRDQALACLPKLVGQAPASTKVVQDKDTWLISSGAETLAVRFIGPATALVVVGTRASQAGTDALLDGGASALPSSQAYVAIRSKLDGHGVWFVANTAGRQLPNMPPGLAAMFGNADVDSGVAADVTLRFDNADGASGMASQLRAASGQLQMFVSKFDVAANDKDVGVQVAMDHDKLMSLLAMAGIGAPGPLTPPAGH